MLLKNVPDTSKLLSLFIIVIAASVTAAANDFKTAIEADWARQEQVTRQQDCNSPQALNQTIDRGRLMIADMRKLGADKAADKAEKIIDSVKALQKTDSKIDYKDMYFKVRWAIRELALGNPAIDFDEVLFVKRQWPWMNHQCGHRVGEAQIPGANLCVLKGLDGKGEVREILTGDYTEGGIGRPDLSYDGKRIVFPFAKKRVPATKYGSNRPGVRGGACYAYDIYEVGIDGSGLKQLTNGPETEDTEPFYLPDGRIGFTTSRDDRFVQCGDWALACGIYTMDTNGGDLQRVTEPKEGEFYPSMLEDGRIMYTRWDYVMKGYNVIQQLWSVYPDGRKASLLYGDHYAFSQGPIAFQEARQIPGTSKIISTGAAHHNTGVGPIMIVDTRFNRGGPESMVNVTPEVEYPEMNTRIFNEVNSEYCGKNNLKSGRSDAGWYSSPYPLTENHYLASYSFENDNAFRTGYGLYLMDVHGNKELIYRAGDSSCYSPIPVRTRPKPRIIPNKVKGLPKDTPARVVITDIYQGLDGIKRGEVKYLRILETFSKTVRTDPQRVDVGVGSGWDVRAVLGTVPVEEDGSVHFYLPPYKQIFFEALDKDFLEIRRMRNFMNVMPGESVSCIGCHEPYGFIPKNVSMPKAMKRPPSKIAAPPWGNGGFSFKDVVQPVLNSECIRCHDGSTGEEKSFDLRGHNMVTAPIPYDRDQGPQHAVSDSFLALLKYVEYIRVGGYQGEKLPLPVNATGSRVSKLMKILKEGHYGVKLDEAKWRALAAWIDTNAQFYGGWDEIVVLNKPVHKVAVNDCGATGKQPFLGSGSNYTYSDKEVSYEKVPSDDPARTFAFGNEVTFYFGGMDPDSGYELHVKYLSDSADRVQSLSVDDQVLQESVKLSNGQVQEAVVEIPRQLYQDGKIVVSIKREQGANAVVSALDVYSTLNQPLTLPLETLMPELKDITRPRLSPIPVQCGEISDTKASLNGTWKFIEKASSDIAKPNTFEDWKKIEVPGEWYMQGFEVEKDTFAGYARTFSVPTAWRGQRVKIRFDAVYSECRVYVNGANVGGHLGGFTPFELDVTDEVVFDKENLITLEVKNESIPDTMASGSAYACHPLGGISRKVVLFVVPEVNISDLTVRTTFDDSFTDTALTVLAAITNEGSQASPSGKLLLSLHTWKQDKPVKLNPDVIDIPALKAGQTAELSLTIPVRDPQKWDCENPNLYVLTCELQNGSETVEIFKQRFGFRQVEVRGNQMYINGRPVKLRGVCRHEAHPLRGRSLRPGLWREDAQLYRDGNCNFIRTSHYPPAEEFVTACDELGLFVEVEAPFCWEEASNNSSHTALTVLQTLEMAKRDKNHPSVIFWSLANESKWGGNFALSSKYLRQADPTRPQIFSSGKINPDSWHYPGYPGVDLVSWHYPGYYGPGKAANQPKPTIFDEYTHLNSYNRFELATDQVLRERWGRYLSQMWEPMYDSPGCLGGAIWSGIDDTFFPPNGMILGYGTWGPIDGWRRPKPEWWEMKKVYSPIRISDVKVDNTKLGFEVENRHDFSNLNRLEIKWKVNDESGTVRSDLTPRSKGTVTIPLKSKPAAGSALELEFIDPRAFVVDLFKLPIGESVVKKADSKAKEVYTVSKADGSIRIQGKNTSYVINASTGLFENVKVGGKQFAVDGPHLMVLPLNRDGITRMEPKDQPIQYAAFTPTCEDWNPASVDFASENNLPVVTVHGAYKEAEGKFTYRFNADGTFTVDYDFNMLRDVNPRQIGVVFDLPSRFGTLHWKRKGRWTTYPDWDIARLEGTANADDGVEATCVGVRTEPRHPWRLDRTAIGSNDFASSKHNIYTASLTDHTGLGLQVLANADRHTRTWIADSSIRLLIADYSNGGKGWVLWKRIGKRDYRPLKKGDPVSGNATLKVIGGNQD